MDSNLNEETRLTQIAQAEPSGERLLEQERIFAELATLIKSPDQVVIESPAEEQTARSCYTLLDRWIADMERDLAATLAPLRAIQQAVTARFKPALEAADRRLRAIEAGLREWHAEQARRAKAAQEAANRDYQRRLRAAKDPERVKPPVLADAPPAKRQTEALTGDHLTWVDRWTWTLPGCDPTALKSLHPDDPRATGLPPDCFVLDVGYVSKLVAAAKGLNPFPQSALLIKNEPVLMRRTKSAS